MSNSDDKRVLQHLHKILHDDLPLCGCGNPETASDACWK